jgi:hypothetical protein
VASRTTSDRAWNRSRLAGKSQNDLLELGVLALPDLKAVPEEALNFPLPWPWVRKLLVSSRDLLHAGEHEDPACLSIPVAAQQIPLTGNTGQMPGLHRPLFKRFGVQFFVLELDVPLCSGLLWLAPRKRPHPADRQQTAGRRSPNPNPPS